MTDANEVLLYDTTGKHKPVPCSDEAASVSWSPSGSSIAIGTKAGTVEVFTRASLKKTRTIDLPECCDEEFEGIVGYLSKLHFTLSGV